MIAFWSNGELKKVAVAGGAPLRLCDLENPNGVVWSVDDVILVGLRTGIQQVPSSGGAPETVLRTSEPVWSPQLLPDGRSYVFSIGDGTNPDSYRVGVWSPGEDAPRVIFEGADVAHYLASGHLLFHVASNDLLAAPFDVSRRELAGSPVPVIEGSDWQFAVARNGTLLYVPIASASATRLVWVDRKGIVSPAVDERRGFRRPHLSSDGRRVAVQVVESNASDLWVYELERGTRTRVTADPDTEIDPVWTPDGESIVFGSPRGGVAGDLFSRSVDGTGETALLFGSDVGKDPHSFSPDGRHLAYYERPNENRDIWILELGGNEKPEPFVVTEFNERSPAFSPDGRFLAYVSDASGRDEIYVQSFPGPGPRTVVSTDGGWEPVWSRDGKELFYRSGDRMMAVTVETAPRFRAGVPGALFEGKFQTEPNAGSGSHTYDVSLDGQKFLMIESTDASRELHIVLNWLDELKARVPAAR